MWSDESDPESTEQVEVVVCGRDHARVLVGPWPEPDDDGVLSDDDRRVVMVRLFDRTPQRQVLELDGRRHVIRTTVAPPTNPVGGDDIATSSRAGALRWSSAPRFVDHEAAAGGGGGPVCPLPGTVIAVHVEAGQQVADGTLLMVVEAMKMEHKIVATADAVVTEVRFGVGERVDQGDLLVSLESIDGAEPDNTEREHDGDPT